MSHFGLIGKSLKHSFSKQYFTDFFEKGNLPHSYSNFEMENIDGLRKLIQREQVSGLNVTIPFKENVLCLLDEIDPISKEIGAANVIKVEGDKLVGFNTDVIGFWNSLSSAISDKKVKALVLGTGGASKAIKFALKMNDIDFLQVSRTHFESTINYEALTQELIAEYQLIINSTPLGTYPDIESKPDIPYAGIESGHILFDLVYNPAETAFLKEGKAKGAITRNGMEMLRIQAEESWMVWNK